ncbi:SGNH/GDSL hydrolase family protein [Sorangium sp. So ce1014]|uniref:SGNH/GDSL hydrolase family protein n=1 Tax=Sorangium sp. So ce1014 TaxID=3133326 RepID=UPI003F6326B6
MGREIRVGRWAFAGVAAAGLACSAAPPPGPSSPGEAAGGAPSGAAPAAGRVQEAAAPAAPSGAAVAPPPVAPPAFTVPPNTAVLHIGDSFALAGFAQALRPRMEEHRVRYAVKAETSSYTVTWASRMELLVANYQPDLVIISLGANEVENVNPPAHAGAIRRIIKAIGGRPCVWVSPPLWRKDTGIIDVIRTNSAPCRFFDSDALVPGPLPRKKDKIHPNEVGGARWADAFWSWLMAEHLPPGEEEEGDPAARRSPWSLRLPPPEEHRSRAQPPESALQQGGTASERQSEQKSEQKIERF